MNLSAMKGSPPYSWRTAGVTRNCSVTTIPIQGKDLLFPVQGSSSRSVKVMKGVL
jgi:hypothetical protein